MARVTEKLVELKGRKFKVKAFDAFTGSYIAFTLFEKMMPMGVEEKVLATLQAEGKDPGMVIPQGRALMTKGEFYAFVRDCLSVVYEVLPGRDAPVLNPNGSWGVEDLEHDTMLVLMLVINALTFNVSDFFTGGGLKDLADSVRDLMPSNIKTSMPGSTPPSSPAGGSSTNSGTAPTP